MFTYIVYYHPHYKHLKIASYGVYLEVHIKKYGRFITTDTTPIVVKKQNTLLVKAKGWVEAHKLVNNLSSKYNDKKHNLASLTQDNYPELYL